MKFLKFSYVNMKCETFYLLFKSSHWKAVHLTVKNLDSEGGRRADLGRDVESVTSDPPSL